MAAITPIRYNKILLAFEFVTGTYSHPCSINGDRAIEFTNTYTQSRLPDCDNTDNPDTLVDYPDTRQCTVNGSGVLDQANLQDFMNLHVGGAAVPAKAFMGGSGGQTVTGNFIVESISINATSKENATVSISGKFTGDYIITPNP